MYLAHVLFDIWGAYRYCGYKVDQTCKALFVGKTFTLLKRLDIYRRLKWFPVCFNAWSKVEFALRSKKKGSSSDAHCCVWCGLWMLIGKFSTVFFCEIKFAQKVRTLTCCKAKQKENYLRFGNWMWKLWLSFQFSCSSVSRKIRKEREKDWKGREKREGEE